MISKFASSAMVLLLVMVCTFKGTASQYTGSSMSAQSPPSSSPPSQPPSATPLKPCQWYPETNATSYYGGSCGTNDAFTIAIPPSELGTSVAGPTHIAYITNNIECEKSSGNETECAAKASKYNCVWAPPIQLCESNIALESYISTCPGTLAHDQSACTALYLNETSCTAAPEGCRWDPVLSVNATRFPALSCFPKDAPSDYVEYRAWQAENIFNIDPATFEKNWGTCAAAQQRYAELVYRNGCAKSVNSEQDCKDNNCLWSFTPISVDACRNDPYIVYSLQLAHSGTLTQQMQCFSSTLTMRGEVACSNYTLLV